MGINFLSCDLIPGCLLVYDAVFYNGDDPTGIQAYRRNMRLGAWMSGSFDIWIWVGKENVVGRIKMPTSGSINVVNRFLSVIFSTDLYNWRAYNVVCR